MVYKKFTIIQAVTIISFFILPIIKVNTFEYDYEDLCSDSREGCRPDNTTLECSGPGRGKCICNRCYCENDPDAGKFISGRYCQCDNYSCARRNGLLCSGRGDCNCGQCVCEVGWTGKDCGCEQSNNHNNSTCISPADFDVVCSGHGQCTCGKCLCDMETEFYSGKYCERCLSCASRCSDLKNCVECKFFDSDENKNKCEEKCGKEYSTVEISDVLEYNEKKDEDHCVFYDENDCKYHFVYFETAASYYENDELHRTTHVRVQKEKICPKKLSTEVQNRTLI